MRPGAALLGDENGVIPPELHAFHHKLANKLRPVYGALLVGQVLHGHSIRRELGTSARPLTDAALDELPKGNRAPAQYPGSPPARCRPMMSTWPGCDFGSSLRNPFCQRRHHVEAQAEDQQTSEHPQFGMCGRFEGCLVWARSGLRRGCPVGVRDPKGMCVRRGARRCAVRTSRWSAPKTNASRVPVSRVVQPNQARAVPRTAASLLSP